MLVTIEPLNKNKLKQEIDTILSIDAHTPGEKWSAENFYLDLPEKWTLSLSLLTEGSVVGFLIASFKNTAIHIHRLAVLKKYQKKGFGKLLIDELIKHARRLKVNRLTLKVARVNIPGIAFYTRLGFVLTKSENLNDWMEITFSE